MGKRASLGHGRYWLSAKPPSRKKKYRQRRQMTPSTLISVTEPTLIVSDVDIDMDQEADVAQNGSLVGSPKVYQVHEALDAIDDHHDVSLDSDPSESVPDFTFEPVDQEAKEEFEPPGTRHVVDFGYMFAELHRKFDNHDKIMGCTFDAVQLVSTQRIGLQTKFSFQCKMCEMKASISSEPEESKILSVNESAVAGAVSIGIGYSHAEEMFNAMNIRFMTSTTHHHYHDEVADGLDKAFQKQMNIAGEEEKRLAIERGDVKNGTLFIPVIADDSWMKRSYRSGRFDSPSGVGVIVGFHTQKVLFAAVRNKYCTICALAEQKNVAPTEHTCFKNWGSNQSSSSMEANAIAEGFLKSVEMHGLVFSSLIADGDSSVAKKISDSHTYDDTEVQKIECTNHLLRNLTNKIKEAATKSKVTAAAKTKVKTMSQSKKSIGEWRKLVEGSTLRFRTAVMCASKYRMAETVNESQKVERLRKDLVNIPSHIFGEHRDCAALGYFCDGAPKAGEENVVPILKELDIYDAICTALTQLSWNAKSLLFNVTSNTVESYNAVVSKFIGGKRVNFGKSNSYNARVAGSVVQFNTQESYAKLSAAMGKAPTSIIQHTQLLRKRFNLKRLEKSQATRKQPRETSSSKPSSSRQKLNSDQDYGLNCNKPDLPSAEFEAQVQLHFLRLSDQQAQRDLIESRTRNQSNCGEWRSLRRKLLTASNFGKVCRMRPSTLSENTVKSILYPQERPLPALEWGRRSESKARQQFKETEDVQVSECGLFIDSEHCYLAASPDGLINDDGLIEIKCLFSAKDVTPEEAIEQKLGDIHRIYDKSNPERMNEIHPYYYQVQGQLHIAQKDYCAFVLWTPKDMKTIKVFRDDIFWQHKMLPHLTRFYESCMLPEIIDSRYLRNMVLREPEYILNAQKQRKCNSNTKS